MIGRRSTTPRSAIRRRTAALALVAALSALFIAPQVSSAGVIDDVINFFSGGASPSQTPGQGGYQPPLHGGNPHGQGTVGVVDFFPSDDRPRPGDPDGGAGATPDPLTDEELVVGRARGEQNGDDYHGHITIVALLGQELFGVDTDEGQTAAGPLDPIQQAILNAICFGSGGNLCASVLAANSNTTNSGSTNHFQAVGLSLGGTDGLVVGVGTSNGNISDDGTCQTAHGDSQAVGVFAGGTTVATVAGSSSDSTACNNAPPSQTNSSSVINLLGVGVPFPATGCATGTPDTAFTGLAPTISTVCNADDSNGSGEPVTQTTVPYGVREALGVFLLEGLGTSFLNVTTAASESAAVAPPLPPTVSPGTTGPGPGGGPSAGVAQPGGEELPFTGVQIALLGLIGAAMLGTGLVVRALAARRAYR